MRRATTGILEMSRFCRPSCWLGVPVLLLVAALWPANGNPWVARALASGPWNDHAVAFTFSSDDGKGVANRTWEPVFVSRGLSYTAFMVSSWVDWTEHDKLTTADLKQFYQDGIEIGSHGRTHVPLTGLTDAQVFDELQGSAADLENVIGGGYHCRTVSYPAHAHDPHLMAIVDSLGFTAARDGGKNPEGYPNFSEGEATWPNTSLFEVPVIVRPVYFVGTDNANTEEETRSQVQRLLTLDAVASENAWVNVFAHSLDDIDAEHMGWILDELAQSDVWIGNFAEIADYYRVEHGLPVSAGVGIPITVELSRFRATGLAQGVLLEWAPVDADVVAGFQVLRATLPEAGYSRISTGMIASSASGTFTDATALPGVMYFYELRAYERTGGSRAFGPVSARVDPELGPRLDRVAPNPSPGGEIRIPFSLPRSGFVTLRILDLEGRTVKTLVEGDQPAGDRSVSWDGSSDRGTPVPAGIYFYELRTPGFQAARKLVRLR